MTTVFEELVGLTKVAIEDDVQASLREMVQAVNNLDDDAWQGLSEGAQNWFNSAAKLLQEDSDSLPTIPGMEVIEKSDEVVAEAVAEAKTVEEPKDPSDDKPETVAEQKPEKTKSKAEKKKPKREGPPVTAIARSIICENIDASYKDVQAIIETRNVKIAPSSLKVVYLNFQKTMEAIKNAGGAKNKEGKIVIQFS